MGEKNRAKFMNPFMLNAVLIISAIFTAVFLVFQRNNMRPGLELYFLVPLFFAGCLIYFNDYYKYAKGGFALKIFGIIMVIRFIMVPFLIALTEGKYNVLPITMPMIRCSADGYQYSILMSIIEMVVCFCSIKYYGKKYESMILNKSYNYRYSNRGLSIIGFLGLCFFIMILLSRDLSVVFSTFNFLTLKEKFEDPNTDAFGILAAQTIKTFVFISSITYCKKKYEKGNSLFWTAVSVLIAILNMGVFFGYNRSFVLQTAVTTIYVLYCCFPKYSKIETVVLVPLSVAVLISMIFIKQFGVSYVGNSLMDQLNIIEFANTVECYVGGPWSLASGFDAAKSVRVFDPFGYFFRDFVSNNFLSYFPGMEWILKVASNGLSSPEVHQLFTRSWQMLPLSSNCLFYGGVIFGPLLSILCNMMIMKMLIYCDYKGKKSVDIGKKYIYVLVAVLLSFSMCYTWVTLLWSFSKNMLFLSLLIYFNQYEITNHGYLVKLRRC